MPTKERPILMSAEMVRAILDRRKTETRRPLKHQPTCEHQDKHFKILYDGDAGCETCGDVHWTDHGKCPYGKPGDRLWVRETWRIAAAQSFGEAIEQVAYKDGTRKRLNDHEEEIASEYAGSRAWKQWMPSIHMPRWASRILLEITEVRVERVQDITEEGAKAEGVDSEIQKQGGYVSKGYYFGRFAMLWNSLYGPDAWEKNDWVWVIKYKVVKP